MESDLFGAYEWAAESYEDLKDVPEAPDRAAVFRGLMRANEALLDKADASMRAADGLVSAEDELDDKERELLSPLGGPRDLLFEKADADTARAFLAAFEGAWARGPKAALVAGAILAALARSNVLASLGRKTHSPEETRALHAQAAALYEEVHAMLAFRVGSGSPMWNETAQSALFRAAAAWRLAGDEARAKRTYEKGGPLR